MASSTKKDRASGERWKIGGGIFALVVLGFIVAYQFVGPPPPKSLVLATGARDGGYQALGEQYKERLAASGVELEFETTGGSLDNLDALRAGKADVALVQGGTQPDDVADFAKGVASVFYEPLWIFHRADLAPTRLADFAGLTLEVGAEGGGTRPVALDLLALNGVTAATATLRNSPPAAAAEALLTGEADVALFVMAPDSRVVARLMEGEGETLRLFDTGRHLAYTRARPYLAHVTLAEGVLDFERNLPDRDIDLLAPTAVLLARADLHPALIPLLVEVAEEVHGTGDLWSPPGTFPSPKNPGAPLAPAAKQYFKNGPSFLYRVFPFSVAATLDRLKIMLLPLLTLLLPLIRLAPPLLAGRTRRKIYRWYASLDAIEASDAPAPERLTELDKLEQEIVDTVEVPPSYARELHDLRLHIARAREGVAGAAS